MIIPKPHQISCTCVHQKRIGCETQISLFHNGIFENPFRDYSKFQTIFCKAVANLHLTKPSATSRGIWRWCQISIKMQQKLRQNSIRYLYPQSETTIWNPITSSERDSCQYKIFDSHDSTLKPTKKKQESGVPLVNKSAAQFIQSIP